MLVCVSPDGGNRYAGTAPPTRLLVGTVDGVFTVERPAADTAWQVTGQALGGQHISALLYEPRRGGLFAGCHTGGLYASLDGGRTWESRTRGLPAEHIWTLASVERDGQVVLYAGTQPMHLCESLDYGETWQELRSLRDVPGQEKWTFPPTPGIAHAKVLAFHPHDPRTIYFGVEQGALLKSTDAGRTWRELDTWYSPDDVYYKDVHRLAISPHNPALIYMATGDGLYRSEDGGETWQHLTGVEAEIGYPDGLVLAPDDDQTVFMAGGRRAPGVWRREGKADAGIARSRDGGRSWELLGGGLPPLLHGNIEALSLAVWPGGYGLYVGTTDGEVWGSDDRGEHWTPVARGLGAVSQSSHWRDLLPRTGQAAPATAS
ncbi:MAG: exo-alpha-sialidase [Chloroflexi bacterium]|nr:exo-alpha-sialidase [Chloroflexota bacterium]